MVLWYNMQPVEVIRMEKELFHVHVDEKNSKNHKWKVNNIITVGADFDSIMSKRHNSFNSCVDTVDGNTHKLMPIYQYIASVFGQINDDTVIKGEKLELIKEMLLNCYNIVYNDNFFKREAGLEECRKDNFSSSPSRLHSIYLCDEDGLEYWTDAISMCRTKDVSIFKVLADGNIFKSNEQLLPVETCTYGQTYSGAFKYWNPKFDSVPSCTNEYLVQGKVKVLECIKKIEKIK